MYYKYLLYTALASIMAFSIWKWRNAPVEVKLEGITMGVIPYLIKYLDPATKNYQYEIDSLLYHWNMSMSTYIPASEISRFNKDSCFVFESPYFLPVLEASTYVYEQSGGAFDPTVGPLVNAWGFGPEQTRDLPDSASIKELLRKVGYHKIYYDNEKVCKTVQGLALDFSAIAKGYAVDVVADFLIEKGIENLMVEIGGEVVCRGKNSKGELWRIGIEDPSKEFYERRGFTAIAQVENRAVATSGNYRNFKMKDGKLLVHTIDPLTGYPAFKNLLSASVFAENCMLADGFATAFMVLGAEKSIEIINKIPQIDAFLIFTDEEGVVETYTSKGIEAYILIQNVDN
ncbi:MAG: FAD:protein FMN transferase [Cyclobacteriaceae bacterium]|nr:FAD:protein FMN transferase [Cyclobacteriaceae bacterium]